VGGELVLLDFWASPFCYRVKIALAEKGSRLKRGRKTCLEARVSGCSNQIRFIKTFRYSCTMENQSASPLTYYGDKFGFLDIIFIPLTSWFYALETFGGFKVEDHCPKLSSLLKRCNRRETVAKVLPRPQK
ncbi:Glutathione S-transferase, C-terminal, partial [Dillenia turbinata]